MTKIEQGIGKLMNHHRGRPASCLCTLLALLLLSGCGELPHADSLAAAEKPGVNIVVLFADDMGYGDLGSYGHPAIRTPHLDRLAQEGQRWTNFYVAAPVCSPSRGALMTGNLPVRSGLYGNKRRVLFPNAKGGIPAAQVTLPEALRGAGYRTAMVGKWHLGDRPEALPTRHGFDEWLGIPYSNDLDWTIGPSTAEIFAAGARGDKAFVAQAIAARKVYTLNPENEYWNIPLIRSTSGPEGFRDEVINRPPSQSLLTKTYTEESIAYIERQAQAKKPFFLYLAYAMPHVPLFRSKDFENVSAGGRYGDAVEEIDWSVGEIRKALEAQGIAENTLVFFSSDNGPWSIMDQHAGSAGPFRGGKGTTFEGGVRVPGIFWQPGTIQPRVVGGIGSVTDLYATALAHAGVPTGEQVVDSVDLSPTFSGQPSPRQTAAFYRTDQLYAFRQGSYKIHLLTEGSHGMPPARMEHNPPLLFHIGEDPGERFDLADKQPQIVAEMLAAIERHRSTMIVAEPIFDLGGE